MKTTLRLVDGKRLPPAPEGEKLLGKWGELRARDSHVIAGGRANWEKTSEFQNKKDAIIKALTDQYALSISNEKHWIKRLLLKIRLRIETRRKLEELSSLRNLHHSKRS